MNELRIGSLFNNKGQVRNQIITPNNVTMADVRSSEVLTGKMSVLMSY